MVIGKEIKFQKYRNIEYYVEQETGGEYHIWKQFKALGRPDLQIWYGSCLYKISNLTLDPPKPLIIHMDQINGEYSEIVDSTLKIMIDKHGYFIVKKKKGIFQVIKVHWKKLSKEYFDIFNNEILELFE